MIFFKKNYVYAHVSVYMCVCKCHWGPERTSDPPELELQVTVTRCWEPSPCPLEEQQPMLLTTSPALSFITRTQETLVYLTSLPTCLALSCVSST